MLKKNSFLFKVNLKTYLLLFFTYISSNQSYANDTTIYNFHCNSHQKVTLEFPSSMTLESYIKQKIFSEIKNLQSHFFESYFYCFYQKDNTILKLKDEKGNNLLHLSVISKNTKMITPLLFLSQPTIVEMKGKDNKKTTIKQSLLNINHKNIDGDTPLHLAYKLSFKERNQTVLDFASALLTSGANSKIENNEGFYPVSYAIQSKFLSLIELDLKQSENPLTVDFEENSLLHSVLINNWSLSEIEKLEEILKSIKNKTLKSMVNSTNLNNHTPLFSFLLNAKPTTKNKDNFLNLFFWLIEIGADYNSLQLPIKHDDPSSYTEAAVSAFGEMIKFMVNTDLFSLKNSKQWLDFFAKNSQILVSAESTAIDFLILQDIHDFAVVFNLVMETKQTHPEIFNSLCARLDLDKNKELRSTLLAQEKEESPPEWYTLTYDSRCKN